MFISSQFFLVVCFRCPVHVECENKGSIFIGRLLTRCTLIGLEMEAAFHILLSAILAVLGWLDRCGGKSPGF